MALQRKLGSRIVELRPSVATTATTMTTTRTFTGAYGALKTKQDALSGSGTKTQLTPTTAGEGTLTITVEKPLTATPEQNGTATMGEGRQVSTGITWMELRKDIATNAMFADVSPGDMKKARDYAAMENGDAKAAALPTLAKKFYDYLVKGTTDYAIGYPVAKRTTTKSVGEIGGGGAWFRDTPPFDHPSGWQWMKTADDRTKEGSTYTQTEEWTGAEEWDSDFYPA
jgi:hypothetical protein